VALAGTDDATVDGVAVFMTYMGIYATRVQGLSERHDMMFALFNSGVSHDRLIGSFERGECRVPCSYAWDRMCDDGSPSQANDVKGMVVTIIAASVVVGSICHDSGALC
jgi:hypothetical protein